MLAQKATVVNQMRFPPGLIRLGEGCGCLTLRQRRSATPTEGERAEMRASNGFGRIAGVTMTLAT